MTNLTEDEQKIVIKVFMSKSVSYLIGGDDSPLSNDKEDKYWEIYKKLEAKP